MTEVVSIGRCYDVILRNGTVIDGSGQPRFTADIAIQGDRLAAIGRLGAAVAKREVDVSGLIVVPGFIDVHTHDDAALIARPEMMPKLTQGVTTVIGGNCGISGAPYSQPGDPPDLLHSIFKSNQYVAATFGEYVEKVREAAPAVNAAFLTGHTTLRMEVMGKDLDRVATVAEIAGMRELLTRCMEEGSLGLSTGLAYSPARAASTHEVIEVAKPLGAYAGIYVTHMRDEGDQVMASVRETLEIGREVGVPVVVSHHKCIGPKNFGRSVETLALLQQARGQQSVSWDVYPYTASSTILNEERAAQASKVLITWCDPYPEFCGQDLDEVARKWGHTRTETIRRLLPAGAVYFLMDEADVTRILCSEGAMIGSDGLPEDQHPHPRLWGTFPRVLGRYVREQQLLTLEEAVHRMTGLSAEQFGLCGRGRIQTGHYADLCIFDPQAIKDTADFDQPVCPAVGIHHVFVNGQFALENGIMTGTRTGRLLLRHDHPRNAS